MEEIGTTTEKCFTEKVLVLVASWVLDLDIKSAPLLAIHSGRRQQSEFEELKAKIKKKSYISTRKSARRKGVDEEEDADVSGGGSS